MQVRTYVLPLLLATAVGFALTACDQSSQNISVDDGSNLTVTGPSNVVLSGYDADTSAEFTARAFTTTQDYSWTVTGPLTDDGTRRSGEIQTVTAAAPDTGTYAVQVETTIDGEDYSGVSSGRVRYPDATSQAASNGMGLFGSLVADIGLLGSIPEFEYTAFGPSDEAFRAALDANDDGEIAEEELPAPGVLADVLRYHIVRDSLRGGDITGQSDVGTDLVDSTEAGNIEWEETIDFNGSGASASVEGEETSAEITTADIATDQVTLHKIDNVLLPSALISISNQDVVRDTDGGVDSVFVAGTLVFDGGFVALHEENSSGGAGDIIGVSDYLEESTSSDPSTGFHNEVGIELNNQLSSDTTDVIAMPHRDDGDQSFNVDTDNPYIRGSSTVPVIDSATVVVPDEE